MLFRSRLSRDVPRGGSTWWQSGAHDPGKNKLLCKIAFFDHTCTPQKSILCIGTPSRHPGCKCSSSTPGRAPLHRITPQLLSPHPLCSPWRCVLHVGSAAVSVDLCPPPHRCGLKRVGGRHSCMHVLYRHKWRSLFLNGHGRSTGGQP